jgi:hypothetical protein
MKLEIPQKKKKSLYPTEGPLNVRVKSGYWKESAEQMGSQLMDLVKY